MSSEWQTKARRWRAVAIVAMLVAIIIAVAAVRSDGSPVVGDMVERAQQLRMAHPWSDESSLFSASAYSEVFHQVRCRHARRIEPANRIGFQNREQAMDTGLRPCAVCRP